MQLEGKIYRDGKFWLVEVPALDLMTQGSTRDEAIFMIKDAIEELIDCYFDDNSINIFVNDYENDLIGIGCDNIKALFAFSLKRQREKNDFSIREMSAKLDSNSPNAYARYEKGRTKITLERYDQIIKAMNPESDTLIRLV